MENNAQSPQGQSAPRIGFKLALAPESHPSLAIPLTAIAAVTQDAANERRSLIVFKTGDVATIDVEARALASLIKLSDPTTDGGDADLGRRFREACRRSGLSIEHTLANI